MYTKERAQVTVTARCCTYIRKDNRKTSFLSQNRDHLVIHSSDKHSSSSKGYVKGDKANMYTIASHVRYKHAKRRCARRTKWHGLSFLRFNYNEVCNPIRESVTPSAGVLKTFQKPTEYEMTE